MISRQLLQGAVHTGNMYLIEEDSFIGATASTAETERLLPAATKTCATASFVSLH